MRRRGFFRCLAAAVLAPLAVGKSKPVTAPETTVVTAFTGGVSSFTFSPPMDGGTMHVFADRHEVRVERRL